MVPVDTFVSAGMAASPPCSSPGALDAWVLAQLCRSARGRVEETLDLGVEIPGNDES